MADFTQIIQEINDDINTNGVEAINGAKLNKVLRDMIAAVKDNNPLRLLVGDISKLTPEQIDYLRTGDIVVESKNGNNVSYTVASRISNVTILIRVVLNTIFSVQYNLYTFGGIGMAFLAEQPPYAIDGNLASLTSSKKIVDSGIASADVVTREEYDNAIALLQQQIDELKNA